MPVLIVFRYRQNRCNVAQPPFDTSGTEPRRSTLAPSHSLTPAGRRRLQPSPPCMQVVDMTRQWHRQPIRRRRRPPLAVGTVCHRCCCCLPLPAQEEQLAEDSRLAEFIARLPKAELHIHVEGTLEPQLMMALAARNAVSLPFADAAAAAAARARFTNLEVRHQHDQLCCSVSAEGLAGLAFSCARW